MAVAIAAHSIRLKGLYVQKKQYERASEISYDVSGRSKDDIQLAVNATEKLHVAYCVFMIGFIYLAVIITIQHLWEYSCFCL